MSLRAADAESASAPQSAPAPEPERIVQTDLEYRRSACASQLPALKDDLRQRLLPCTTCLICLEPIAPGCSVLMEPCLHAVCKRCADAGPRTGCYVCSSNVLATPSDAGDVVHRKLHPLVELLVARRDQQRCVDCGDDMSEEDAVARNRCVDCDRAMCNLHSALHARSTRTRHHTTVALAAAARGDLDLGEVEPRGHGEDAHRAQPGATSRTNSERSAPRGCRATLCRTVRDTPTSRRA